MEVRDQAEVKELGALDQGEKSARGSGPRARGSALSRGSSVEDSREVRRKARKEGQEDQEDQEVQSRSEEARRNGRMDSVEARRKPEGRPGKNKQQQEET
jgi:hypothetical protein